MKPSVKSSTLDQLGMTASIACAIHCAALPFFITTLPLWGIEFLAHTWFELSMICLSLLIGTYALTRSFAQHRKLVPVLVLIIGFGLIATGHYTLESLEAIFIPIGGFTIAAAHYLNWKYSRRCSNHHNPQP